VYAKVRAALGLFSALLRVWVKVFTMMNELSTPTEIRREGITCRVMGFRTTPAKL